MAKITFIDHGGESRTVNAENRRHASWKLRSRTVFPALKRNAAVPVLARRCHVYVDEAWTEIVGAPSPMEEDMLDFGFRREAEFAPVMSDQGKRSARWAGVADA